jgi:adenylate cyclase
LGDIDDAFDLVERFLPRVGPELHQWFKHDSNFDALRSHPRYKKILELLGEK